MKRNVGELEICASSNFQLRTTLGAQKNAKKTKIAKIKKIDEKIANFVNPYADLGIYCLRNLLERAITFLLNLIKKIEITFIKFNKKTEFRNYFFINFN